MGIQDEPNSGQVSGIIFGDEWYILKKRLIY